MRIEHICLRPTMRLLGIIGFTGKWIGTELSRVSDAC
jgi:hypothetical protein